MASTTPAVTVRHSVAVELPREEAFARFVDDMHEWWPAEYTWSGAALQRIGMEPRAGGMCFEIGPHGFRCDWGRIVAFDPGRRIVFTWQIGAGREPVPDPARASEVEVRFSGNGAGPTTIELEHRGFERHGEGAEGYAKALGSQQGWPYILNRYAAGRA